MKKKVIISILALTLFGSSFPVQADEIDSLKDKIKNSESEKQSLEKKQETVGAHIHNTEEKIDKINKVLNDTQVKIENTELKIVALATTIKETEEEIRLLQIELDKKKEILARNLQIMNTKGDVSYLEFLFSSENVSDFLYRFSTIKDIAKANKDLYEEVRVQSELMKEKKLQLESQKKEQEIEKANLVVLKEEQVKLKAEQEKLLKEYEAEYAHIEQEINEQEAAIATINSQIANIVREREEARKKREAAQKQGQPLPPSSDITGSGFSSPMHSGTYYVSSHYGWRIHPVHGTRRLHGGIDLAAGTGTPIYAADGGTVLYSGAATGFGNWIVIDHNNGYLTVYGHMYSNQLYVSPGQQVSKGQHIGGVGSAGTSTGAHLHFEVHKSYLGNQVNPTSYMGF